MYAKTSICWVAIAAGLLVAACGGGDGDGGTTSTAPSPPASQPPASQPPTSQPPATTPDAPPSPPPAPAFPETVLAFSGAAQQPQMPLVRPVALSLPAGAMVYDSVRNELLVSVLLSGTIYGVMALTPATLTPVWTVQTAGPATVLAISDDASQLYAGLFFDSAIQQFDLNTRSLVRTFPVAATGSGIGPFDIAVRPGARDAIAVSMGSAPLIPIFAELAMFVSGVRQPRTYPDQPTAQRASQIEFLDASTLLAFDNETTAYALTRLSVISDGLRPDMHTLANCCFDSVLTVANGRVFIDSGTFVDPTSLKAIKSVGRGVTKQLFHPGANSTLQIFRDPEGGYIPSAQLRIEEYDVDRGYLKRRFRSDENIAGSNPVAGVFAEIAAAVPTGPSTFALLVRDAFSGATAILAYDLAAIPTLDARTFTVQRASAGSITALAISLPVHSYAYDSANDRLIASVVPWLGVQGSSLAVLRADDGSVERLVPLSSEPRAVAVSANGNFAYVSLPFESAIQQVDIRSGVLGWKARIELLNAGASGASMLGLATDSISVKPDDARLIAIAGGQGGATALVREGVLVSSYGLSPLFPDGSRPYTSAVVFNGATELLGLDLVSSAGSLQRFTVGASSLIPVRSIPGLLDPFVLTTKVGHGFVYGTNALADLAVERRVGRFVTRSADFFLFDQTLLLSDALGIGHNQRLNSSAGAAAEFYELLTRTTAAAGTLEFVGQSRVKITDATFGEGFKGMMVPAGPRRFVQAFTKFADGTGVIYIVSVP